MPSENKEEVGLVAQELKKIAPKLVDDFVIPNDKHINEKYDETEYLKINDSAIKYMLINAIKEQQKQIDVLINGRDQNPDIIPASSSEEIKEFKNEIKKQSKEIETLKILVEALLEEKVSGIDRIEVALENSIELESPYISQNIPNPTANDAIIKYYVPEHAISAKINFFSLSGQPLKSVDIAEMGQGELKVDLDRMMSGSYMYHLMVDGEIIDTKTMVIIK